MAATGAQEKLDSLQTYILYSCRELTDTEGEIVMSESIATLTDANFSSELGKSALPILVDFWASWCGPCQMMAPVLEQIAGEFSGRLVVAKLNVDENQLTAGRYGVMSIPTLIVFKNGTEATRFSGYRPQEELSRMLNQAIG